MIKKFIISVVVFVFYSSTMFAQGYKIEVQVDGAKDSTLLLAVYNGNGKYIRDSAKTDKQGYAVFTKNKPLAGGMYILVAGQSQLCDFLISDDKNQNFNIHYKKEEEKKTAEIIYKNSPENTAFAEFQKYMAQRQMAGRRIRERAMKDSTFIPIAKDSLKIIEKEEKIYLEKISVQWSDSFFGTVVKAITPPQQMPELNIPKDAQRHDSIRWINYYLWEKNHFFDNINLADKRLLNTPFFLATFNYYFTNKIIQQPDSLISAIHPVLERAKASQEMFMFCLGHLFNTYIQNKAVVITPEHAVGMEAVVIDLIKSYYLSGEAGWAQKDTVFMRQIRDYLKDNESSLVGKKAHNVTMETLTQQTVSLYDIQSPYLLLIFFDTDCGHCKKEIPLIHDLYKKYHDKGFDVFCVYIKGNGPEWTKFVDHAKLDWINVWDPYRKSKFDAYYNVSTTPQMYLLNKDKTIIARQLSHDFLSQLLGLYIDKIPISNSESMPATKE